MNIVFGIRGEKYLQQIVIDHLNCQNFFRPKTKDGKTIKEIVSHCVQPINLYSFAAPKEYENQIYTSLNFNNERYTYGSLKSKMALAGIRKAMGLKPIPKFKPCDLKEKIPLPEDIMKYMHVFPIGMKNDLMSVDEEGFTKEMI